LPMVELGSYVLGHTNVRLSRTTHVPGIRVGHVLQATEEQNRPGGCSKP